MASTKKDLQARIEELESQLQQTREQYQDQVTGLQDELTIKSNALHQTEEVLAQVDDAITQAQDAVRGAKGVYRQLDYERNLTTTLVTLVDDMSRQFRWALSMFDTITLYTKQENDEAREQMLQLLTTETDGFVELFDAGTFDGRELLPEIEAEREALAANVYDITDVTDLLANFFDLLGVEETEVDPDPTPFSFEDVRTETVTDEPSEPTPA